MPGVCALWTGFVRPSLKASGQWLAVLLLLAAATRVQATGLPGGDALWFNTEPSGPHSVKLYFFWSNRCPHCLQARPFVKALASRHDWVDLESRELHDVPENRMEFLELATLLGETPRSVPTFMLCGQSQVGWGGAESTGALLEQKLSECYRQAYGEAPPGGTDGARDRTPGLSVPLLGRIDDTSHSLALITVVVAGLDAFNPCAFFVLLFLLSLLVHTRNRRLMLLVGAVFVLISGVMYFAFMAAWLNLFLLIGAVETVTTAAGLLALVVALMNIKDFVWFREGVSLTLSDGQKQRLFRRSRALLKTDNIPVLLTSTALLALVANLYELLCTAGFPMAYTRLLTLHELPTLSYYLYLVLYNAVYVTPLLLIVSLFVATLGARKLRESEGRFLKLLSGMMMLALGVLLLTAPERLDSLATAAMVLAGALAGTGLFLAIGWLVRRRGPGQTQ
jgi:hypothetical protein